MAKANDEQSESKIAADTGGRERYRITVDEASTFAIRGWATDRRQTESPVLIKFLVDGNTIHEAVCDGERQDVLDSGQGPLRVGFAFSLPERLNDGRRHGLSLRDEFNAPLMMLVEGFPRVEIDLVPGEGSTASKPDIISHIDSFKDGHVQGWVLRMRETSEGPRLFGKVTVALFYNGQFVLQEVAEMERSDVAESLNGEISCGFRIEIPTQLLSNNQEKVLRLYTIPELRELTGSPCIRAATPY